MTDDVLKSAPPAVTEAFKRLTKRERAFALALPKAGSQEAAAIQAGYTAKTARANAATIAARADVRAVVDHIVGSAIVTAEITYERCMKELSKLAFGDPGTLFGPDGEMLPPSEWPEAARAMIAEVQHVDLHDERGTKIGRVNKMKFGDKHAALRTAFQLIDAFPDKKKQITHTHRVGVVVVPSKVMTEQNADALEGVSTRIEQPKRKGNAPAFMVKRVKALAKD